MLSFLPYLMQIEKNSAFIILRFVDKFKHCIFFVVFPITEMKHLLFSFPRYGNKVKSMKVSQWERSVFTLGSQVRPANPALCRIHREAIEI